MFIAIISLESLNELKLFKFVHTTFLVPTLYEHTFQYRAGILVVVGPLLTILV